MHVSELVEKEQFLWREHGDREVFVDTGCSAGLLAVGEVVSDGVSIVLRLRKSECPAAQICPDCDLEHAAEVAG